MMKRIAEGATRIFLACGTTDFCKQIPGLLVAVTLSFKLDPYNGDYVFIFCNRKRDSIKVLRYDQNGFVLATKKLLDDMKFQWPRTPDEVKKSLSLLGDNEDKKTSVKRNETVIYWERKLPTLLEKIKNLFDKSHISSW